MKSSPTPANLETIDICRSKNTHRDENGHFGLLRAFHSLKHLRIQTEVLLGGCCRSPRASFQLKDTLPAGLETLALFGEEGFNVISDLPVQIRELLSEDDFPALSSIILDDMSSLFTDDGQALRPPYRELDRVWKNRQVSFRVAEASSIFGSAGVCRELRGEKALYMQEDGAARHHAASYNRKQLRDHKELLLRSTDAMDDNVNCDYNSEEDEGKRRLALGTTTRTSSSTTPPGPFTDHTNKPAYMVFANSDTIPLPPLFSFSIYFTHPAATPENINMLKTLYQEINPPAYDLRYDMYFLPGASPEACIAHFNSEKTVRGSYKDQIRTFETRPRDELTPGIGSPGQLPGMVKKYHQIGSYRGILFICPDEKWQEDGLLCVKFNRKDIPADNNEGELDVGGGSPLPPSPPVNISRRPLNQQDPAYLNNFPNIAEPIGDIIHDSAHWARDIY
ncbi:hypothetical protein BDW59DRAFT_51677 [Aspergillus cavernicola]|uniref:Uncharacterized protein n=1 Tax=Aspergillus cavernicola TaxID=176166 RepID=A0ABR4IKD2_9EURO